MDQTNTSNCTLEYFTTNHVVAAAARVPSSLLCAVLSLTSAFVIVVFKRYVFFLQRLVLYYSIGGALWGLAAALQRTEFTKEEGGKDRAATAFCAFTGFLSQYAGWSTILAFCCLTLGIFFKATFRDYRSPVHVISVVIIFIVPAAVNWIPFLRHSYGRAEYFCWIRNQNPDCSEFHFGLLMRIVVWYVPFCIALSCVLMMYVAALVAYLRQRRRFHERSAEGKRTKWLLALIVSITMIAVSTTLPMVNYSYRATGREALLPLRILSDSISLLTVGSVAIVFSFNKEVVKKFNRRDLARAIVNLRSRSRIREVSLKSVNEDCACSTP